MKEINMRVRQQQWLSVLLAILFLLFTRTILLTDLSVDFNPIANTIYAKLSQIGSLFIVIAFICFSYKRKKINLGIIFFIAIYWAISFLSTHANKMTPYTIFRMSYPVVAMACLLSIVCATSFGAKLFINSVANLLLFLSAFNLVWMLIVPDYYSDHIKFLGIRNQLTFSLCIGVLFSMLDYIYNQKKLKYVICIAIYFITVVMIWSANALVASFIFAICLFVPFVKKRIVDMDITIISLLLFSAVALLVTVAHLNVLECQPFKFIFEKILKRQANLTFRKDIWDYTLGQIWEHIWLGHGINTSSELPYYFYIPQVGRPPFQGYYSVHNQYLQTLYEGGIFALLSVMLLFFVVSKKLGKSKEKETVNCFKLVLIPIMFLLMAESAGWDCLFFLFNFATILCPANIKVENSSEYIEKIIIYKGNNDDTKKDSLLLVWWEAITGNGGKLY